MRFRVTHLLLVMAIAGIYATALGHPTSLWNYTVCVTTIGIFCYLAKGMKTGSPFHRSFCKWALFSGFLYPVLQMFALDVLPARFQEWLMARTNRDEPPYFAAIFMFTLTLLFAFLGGALGAFWSKSQSEAAGE
jgi:hypothetical protein